MSAEQLIGPAPVTRDAHGWWAHPELPEFRGDATAFCAWIYRQGLALHQSDMESELIEHHYWAERSGRCDGWDPEPPAGQGWFLLAICDTDDGPCASWVRRPAPKAVPA